MSRITLALFIAAALLSGEAFAHSPRHPRLASTQSDDGSSAWIDKTLSPISTHSTHDAIWMAEAPRAVEQAMRLLHQSKQPFGIAQADELPCLDDIWEGASATCAEYAAMGSCDDMGLRWWCKSSCGRCGEPPYPYPQCQDQQWDGASFTCTEHRDWNHCDLDWMTGVTPEGDSWSWCDRTCGRCDGSQDQSSGGGGEELTPTEVAQPSADVPVAAPPSTTEASPQQPNAGPPEEVDDCDCDKCDSNGEDSSPAENTAAPMEQTSDDWTDETNWGDNAAPSINAPQAPQAPMQQEEEQVMEEEAPPAEPWAPGEPCVDKQWSDPAYDCAWHAGQGHCGMDWMSGDGWAWCASTCDLCGASESSPDPGESQGSPGPGADEPVQYMSSQTRSIDLTTRYFDGCKPACGWTGNVYKEVSSSSPTRAMYGCGVVKPGEQQDKGVSVNARSACSDGGTSYACMDTSAFTLEKADGSIQRYAFAALPLDIAGGPYSCCECYEATFTEVSERTNTQGGGSRIETNRTR